MEKTTELSPQRSSRSAEGAADPGRFLIALVALIALIVVLYLGFLWLRDTSAPGLVIALVAIVWGVGGIALLFTFANMLVEALSNKWRDRIQPYIFVGPAILMLAIFLFEPALATLWQSFFDASSTNFVGLSNFSAVFTDGQMQEAFVNNLIWLIVGTALCVVFGLLIAVLADRSRFEVGCQGFDLLADGDLVRWRERYLALRLCICSARPASDRGDKRPPGQFRWPAASLADR